MIKIIENITSIKYIWIYGAGVIGNIAVDCLQRSNIRVIDGIVVTHKKSNCVDVKGIPVFSMDEIATPSDQTLFIIAVSEKYQCEIQTILESKGYTNYLLWNKDTKRKLWKLAEYRFEDRRKYCEKVCFVLSGYKEFLWKNVFSRLSSFVPDNVEICILSSGIYHPDLAKIAQQNEWSYLSTNINSVTLIQNIAIEIFDDAKWIFKMDEDMFLTEGCFEKLLEVYHRVNEREHYQIGFVAPTIPLNGYGYFKLLDKFNLISEYEKNFGRAFIGGNRFRSIEKEPEAASYMWGITSNIPQLDILNRMMRNEEYSFCNVRFSIGFIMFTREFWNELGGFDVSGGSDMGYDESQLGIICIEESYAIVVAENTVVGHFSFGKQTQVMKEYYEKNPEWFEIR